MMGLLGLRGPGRALAASKSLTWMDMIHDGAESLWQLTPATTRASSCRISTRTGLDGLRCIVYLFVCIGLYWSSMVRNFLSTNFCIRLYWLACCCIHMYMYFHFSHFKSKHFSLAREVAPTMVWTSDHRKVEFWWKLHWMQTIGMNTRKYITIHIRWSIHVHTYQYQRIRWLMDSFLWLVLVGIMSVVYRPILIECMQIQANTCKSGLNTYGDKTHRFLRFKLASILHVFGIYWHVIVTICQYLYVFSPAEPYGFCPRQYSVLVDIRMYWHVVV